MEIFRLGARPARLGEEGYFQGTVILRPIIQTPDPASLKSVLVTFAPGGRTHWHSHTLGQTLHVTEGIGRVQSRGQPLRAIRAGDTVWIPPGKEHWHGAAPDHPMTHVAMQESPDGDETDWLEGVSDADFAAAPED